MRKSLFAIGLLAISYSVQAQILCHVDTNANMYVSEGTLVYSGGGVQTKGTGLLEVHGNVMVVGSGADAFKTIDAGGANKTDGGNIVLKMNTPSSYATSTYGQLYIDGLSQSNVTGVVSKEYRNAKHGDGNFYQQMALPFNNKVLSTLSPELNKTFTDARYSKNEILTWDNATVVSNTLTTASATQVPYGYYMLGSNNNNLDLSTPPGGANAVYTVNGQPFSNLPIANLQNAGNNIDFGPSGTYKNSYNEKYNTYLYDQFEETASPWAGNYGKNIYEFGNPFLTNLDLSAIGYLETTPNGITDGNAINNIWAVQYYPGSVQYTNAGSSFTDPLIMTYDENTHIPVGDVNNLMVKPMGVFIMKLRDNTAQTLNFNTLRRFSNTARPVNTDYNVNAKKAFGKATGTIKQLGVIGLDANGKELGRTYYVVSGHATTGHQTSTATTVQAAAGDNLFVTYEEKQSGGIDPNYQSNYSLYINEANEKDFLGKEILLNSFDYNEPNHIQKIVSYKFEVRENADKIPAGIHQLSSGTGFYYKTANGNVEEIKQDAVIPVNSKTYSLYYGAPDRGSLATKEDNTKTLSRTMVVYNPAVSNYIVRFDKNWKKADIEVYDMSGKLIISKKAVDASKDFVIELDGSVKSSYVVKVVSDKGVIVNTKILK
ncbi:T9SS type A sorting domain-containing protein [Chryseobacterium jejuense]|uniref:Por secretion system C-terminal sorting domain n=1 Tax=Chryseobacterium jejuense TaxID=445960 RepID=A0A2X2X154_CHRJE|nr:T9SS type A sorting domain-containing protein [Chryseobacterium jejuense]SDJ89451.1 Por secretion system C-terminal sorting domain-containing protein [Chryseobacterium jejuense]SQB45617.1 Por secretion system C-terminal sorting domain [Chryseobacterium jejuense]